MSYQKKQRTRIEDLSPDGNELFDLSDQMMMMVGGGYEGQTGGMSRPDGGVQYDHETYYSTDNEHQCDEAGASDL
jgi:hypothetical protein